jgi:hypothetical protein
MLRETKELLSRLYDVGIIYPKYRGIVAVTAYLEYIQSGRCDSLGEAYNLFQEEVNANKIMAKLDDVITHLGEIRDNQYLMYTAIQESNRIASVSLSELRDTNRSVTAAALYAKQNAANSKVLVDLNRDKYNRLVTKGGRILAAK